MMVLSTLPHMSERVLRVSPVEEEHPDTVDHQPRHIIPMQRVTVSTSEALAQLETDLVAINHSNPHTSIGDIIEVWARKLRLSAGQEALTLQGRIMDAYLAMQKERNPLKKPELDYHTHVELRWPEVAREVFARSDEIRSLVESLLGSHWSAALPSTDEEPMESMA